MSDRAFYIWIGLISAAIVAIIGGIIFFALNRSIFPNTGQRSAGAQQPQCQTFPETGKTLCHGFLKYWTEHGGVARQGFPISMEFQEVSDIDGKPYTVQYFERAVYEYHPENQQPYDILLSLLGTIQYRSKYPDGIPELEELENLPTEMNPEGAALFPQTGKEVRGIFLDYWLANGGPLQYGYPISNAFIERSQLDGIERIVQYFERSIFEFHPENAPSDYVQIALSGSFQFERKYPNGELGLATATPAPGTPARASATEQPGSTTVLTPSTADPGLNALTAAVEANPNDRDAREALARWYSDHSFFAEAARELETIIAQDPLDMAVRHQLGDAYQAAGQPDNALRAWEHARDADPNNPAGRNKLGIAYNTRQRFDDAIREFQAAVKTEPRFVEAWYHMGTAYEAKGDVARAREAYQGAIDYSPEPSNWSDYARQRQSQLK